MCFLGVPEGEPRGAVVVRLHVESGFVACASIKLSTTIILSMTDPVDNLGGMCVYVLVRWSTTSNNIHRSHRSNTGQQLVGNKYTRSTSPQQQWQQHYCGNRQWKNWKLSTEYGVFRMLKDLSLTLYMYPPAFPAWHDGSSKPDWKLYGVRLQSTDHLRPNKATPHLTPTLPNISPWAFPLFIRLNAYIAGRGYKE